jgi:DNA-binding transcriptional regulator GbsR (MarR family)
MRNIDKLEKARQRVIDSVAKNMDLYGVTPSVGRLYGILFFHDGPMTLDEMGESLGMSKTSMSAAVRILTELKMVEKVWKKGVRKDLYVVEEDWYQTFIDFFCLKWRKGIEMNMNAIRHSLAELNQLVKDETTDHEVKQLATADLRKLNHALEYYNWLSRLVDSFESHEIFTFIPKTENGQID